jgi:hypothetical protein
MNYNNSKKQLTFFILFLSFFPATISCWGQDKEKTWYESISVNGFLSASYSYNFNKPMSNQNQYRSFDFDNNTFKIDVAELLIQKQAVKINEAGFKVDFTAGSSIPKVIASQGLFRDKNGNANDFDIPQAYISYIAPVGEGLRFDIGKFYTNVGYELIEGYEGFNTNSTHSFLFGLSEPATHTGLHIVYPFSDKICAMVMIVNGWDNAVDNNKSKSVGAQLSYTPFEDFQIYANFIGGPEKDNNNTDNRFVYNLSINHKLTKEISWALAFDYGMEQGMLADNSDAKWYGGAAYLDFTLSEKFNVALRGEVFSDKNGARTGINQTLSEITLTPQYKFTPNFMLRSDIRLDNSNQFVFDKEGLIKKNQLTVMLNALYWF